MRAVLYSDMVNFSGAISGGSVARALSAAPRSVNHGNQVPKFGEICDRLDTGFDGSADH